MSLPIERLLRMLAGKSRRPDRSKGRRRGLGLRRPDSVLLDSERLEARSMLAVTISLMPGGQLMVTQDSSNPGETVGVKIVAGTVAGATGPVQTTGITITGNTAGGSPIPTGQFIPFNDPISGAVNVAGVSLAMVDTTSEVQVNDQLAAVLSVNGGGAWSVGYGVGGGSSGSSSAAGSITITSPSKLNVSTFAKDVGVNGNFAGGQGWLKVAPTSMVLGKSATVSGTDLNFATSGAGAIQLQGSVQASSTLTLRTDAAFDVSNDLSAPVLSLTVNAGATQSGGVLTGSTSFLLTASGGGVTFNRAGNNLATIAAITAGGQDIVLKTSASVAQTGAILARSLSLTAGGAVTLDDPGNDLDSVAIKAGGNISYTDADAVQIGVAGGTFGLTANSGLSNVTVTTANDLTQTTAGAVQAAQLTAKLLTGAGGGRLIKLDSPNNQVGTFVAETTAFGGGGITFVNAANKPLTVGDGVNTISSASDISITTQGAGAGTLTLASPLATPASITLVSGGGITQAPGAVLTANTLSVTNNALTGAIVLDAATGGNDVAILSIRNNSTGAAKGISFMGSNAASNKLQIAGTGIAAAAGNIVIDANGRPLAIGANVSTVAGNVALVANNGVSQTGGGISGNTLTVTNGTSGDITLTSNLNDVATVAIANNAPSGSVAYTDANDLTLTTVGAIAGIKAGDSIALIVGGNFLAPAGTGLTSGGAGTVTVAAAGTVSLSAATTAGAGASISGSGITVAAPITGGTAGSVTLVAATTGVNVSDAVTAKQDVVLTGPTSVALGTGASVTAAAGRITVSSTAGGFVSAAGVPLSAGTNVSVTAAQTVSLGGLITTGTDLVVTTTGAGADIVVNGGVNSLGKVSLASSGGITTSSAIVSSSFGSTSVAATSLGGSVATSGAFTVAAGGTFGNSASVTSGGAIGVTSTGNLVIGGAVQGTVVTLTAGTSTAPADVTLKNTLSSTTGGVTITATGGTLSTNSPGAITSAGDVSLAGTTGAAFAAAITAGGNVTVKSSAGDVNFGAGSGIVATTKTTTLAAATGIVQDAGSLGIQCNALVATNGTSGSIALDNPSNDAVTFRATNLAAGAGLTYVDASAVTLSLPGTSTNNGSIEITAGGAITVAGTLSSGTADTDLTASGAVTQAATGTITANKLGVDTSAVAGGSVTLNKANNSVAIIYGATKGGAFSFTGKAALQVGVANLVDLVTTANGGAGADIAIAAGQGGTGALSLAANSISAGTGVIGLQAKGGISDLTNVTISTTNALALANTVSGGITLSSPTSTFSTLAATSVAGSAINILDNTGVVINAVTVPAISLTAAGLQTAGGTIVLKCNGPISQAAAGTILASSASFTSTGAVDLAQATSNNVATLAIQAIGNVGYTDFDSFAVGVGSAGVVGQLGNIALTSKTGSITLNAEVSTTSSAPWDPGSPTTATTITAAGSITQTASQVISGDLVMAATGGSITLAQTTNDIANLRASAGATVTYVDANDFEVGLDSDAIPAAGAGTVTVNAGAATFSATQTPPLAIGDVIVINSLPYRITAIAGTTYTLASGNGSPLTTAATAFGILRPKAVGPDLAVPGKFYGVTAGGNLTLTAGPAISVSGGAASAGPVGLGLLRVTEGLAWSGSLSLKAGLDSRPLYVDFAVTNSGEPGLGFNGSIRDMIGYANANVATQTINGASRAQPMRIVFDESNYPVTDITLKSALPAIVKPLDINGTMVETTVTNPRVGLNGGAIPTTSVVNGLVYAPGSNDSRITGLSVYGFATGSGLQLRSAVNTVINSYFGVRRDGTTIAPNKIGIELTGQTSTTNTIGTVLVNELAANVIGGNTYAGIVARNGSTGNAIVGNYIGTDSAGNKLGNSGFGISLEGVNGNVIGTRNAVRPDGTVAASNVIANNNNSGLRIADARAATANLGNIVENNLIDANGIDGIQISASAFQTVGGQQPRQANVITRQVGSPTAGGNGISVTSSTDISIFSNYIGVDEAGSTSLGNARAGVLVDKSTRTVVSAGNRIGRNATGVTVRNGATATSIEANYIGTNEFDADLGNTVDGVAIDRSVGSFIRLGNVIANNDVNGVNITDSSAATLAVGNVVSGNTIRGNGTAGTGAGVRVAGGARSTIGGAGVGNVIISNAREGVLVEATSYTGSAVGVAIQGNYIGTGRLEEVDPTLGNTVGIRLKQATNAVIDGRNVIANSTQDGVRIEGSTGTTLGSATAGAGNVIRANTNYGAVVTDQVTGQTKVVTNQGNSLFGNTITGNAAGGVFIRGTSLANGSSSTSSVVVGRRSIPGLALVGQGNTITGNAGVGVTVDAAQSVLVQGNSIYGNTDASGSPALPISILNGGNAGAVAPTLTSATITQKSGSGAQVTVQGSFVTAGTGSVTVVNGRATFSTPQSGATVGSVVMINGTGYTITQVISSVPAGSTVVQLQGNPSTVIAGNGRVASNAGVATFSVAQSPSLVGQSIIVAGRSYQVTSLSADGRTARLAGNPTFLVSSFTTVQPVSFGMLPASVLGQQYVIDIYLNNPGDGTPGAGGAGTGYAMRTFLGQAVVTIGATGPGTFTATVALPLGVVPAGQYITATASTMRAAAGTSAFSTSQATTVARQLVLAGPGK